MRSTTAFDVRGAIGLTVYGFNVLLALDPVREQTPRELADQSNVPRTKVHSLMDELVEKGFARAIILPNARPSLAHPRKTYVRLRMPSRESMQQLVNQIDSEIGFLESWRRRLQLELDKLPDQTSKIEFGESPGPMGGSG